MKQKALKAAFPYTLPIFAVSMPISTFAPLSALTEKSKSPRMSPRRQTCGGFSDSSSVSQLN